MFLDNASLSCSAANVYIFRNIVMLLSILAFQFSCKIQFNGFLSSVAPYHDLKDYSMT